ncbi:MAG TPA: ribosome-binding factor A [Polyangiaceae bacterium]|nr:ribosome-binding factor A [Polyangiaceae bacterium]
MTRRTNRAGEGHRLLRLEQLLLEELKTVFADELTDRRLESVRPFAVTLSPDYRHARVHCLVEASPVPRAELDRALSRAAVFLRTRVADSIELKRVPELNFVLDSSG